jgi:hypothetical protein
MTVRIKAHFDGKTIVPDEPVDVPAGTTAVVEFSAASPVFPMPTRQERRAALERIISQSIQGVGIPLEALRRENLYEDRS